jgi:hypothetical protein
VSARARSTLAAVILCWSVMVVAALVAAHWPALIGLLAVPALGAIVACLGLAWDRRRVPDPPPAAERPPAVPPRSPMPPPRRRARPHRADQPPGPPPAPARPGPLTPWAAARFDQELMRLRADNGATAPDYDDFVALMRDAGAGDLEDVAAPDTDDQDGTR